MFTRGAKLLRTGLTGAKISLIKLTPARHQARLVATVTIEQVRLLTHFEYGVLRSFESN